MATRSDGRQALFDHVCDPVIDMGRFDPAHRHGTEPWLDPQPPRSLIADAGVQVTALC